MARCHSYLTYLVLGELIYKIGILMIYSLGML